MRNLKISDKLATKQDSITLSTSRSLGSIATTGNITASTVELSSKEYADSSGLDKLRIKGVVALEVRDKTNVLLCSVSAHEDSGYSMKRHLFMNNYDISGGSIIGANNNISAVGDITANYKSKGQYVEISQTATFTGDLSAPNIYTKSGS